MSQKKNNGREFTVDLGDDDVGIDFGDDPFDNIELVENSTLEELLIEMIVEGSNVLVMNENKGIFVVLKHRKIP